MQNIVYSVKKNSFSTRNSLYENIPTLLQSSANYLKESLSSRKTFTFSQPMWDFSLLFFQNSTAYKSILFELSYPKNFYKFVVCIKSIRMTEERLWREKERKLMENAKIGERFTIIRIWKLLSFHLACNTKKLNPWF